MSPRFNADPTADKGSVFPEGEYFLTCVDVQDEDKEGNPLRSRKSGYDMYVLEMAVADGPMKNRRLWHYLPFIPAVKGSNNGHGMTLRCLHAFGIPTDGPIDVTPAMFKGKTVHCKVAIEQNDPQYDPKNVIKKFYVVDDPSKVPAPAEKAPDDDTPGWVEEGTSDGARRAAAAATPPAPPARAAAAPAKAKAPWR